MFNKPVKRKSRVLVIDDDRTTRLMAGAVIKELDCEFSEAASGELGLAKVREQLPDLILLDLTMPGMDGFEVCRALRADQNSAEVPILMLTGMDDNKSIRQAFEVGASDFFTKPINLTILSHRIRYMLRASNASAALRSSEQRLSHAQRISMMGEWEMDLARGCFETSSRLRELLNLAPDRDLMTIYDFCSCFDQAEQRSLIGLLGQLCTDGQPFVFEHRRESLCADGALGLQYFRHYAEVLARDKAGQPIRLVGCLQDITESKRVEARVQQLAYFDSSTGLANRTYFAAQVDAACQDAASSGLRPAVLMIDLDRFKRINDTLGYSVGDEVLKMVGERLSDSLRKGEASLFFSARDQHDCIARLGGDEFGVLLRHIDDADQALAIAQRLQKSLDEPINHRGRELSVSGAFGLALYGSTNEASLGHEAHQPKSGPQAASLMIQAEVAMYRAKERSDRVILMFEESMNVGSIWRLDFENDLRNAIDRNELFLQFQPKVELATGRICGAEALIRWKHPISGLVSPADFIPIAEEVGLIIPIGRWVLESVCKQLVAWRVAGVDLVPVAVNLATPHIRLKGLASEISQLLVRYDLDASLIQIEVTESLMMDDLEVCVNTLSELRDLGVEIAIDDFGVGYSSLAYLKRLPITTLKIDRAFIRDISEDPDDAAITSAILAMAHRLDLKVVAEGVETVQQLEFLRALNCDQYQGYFFSRPVMPEQFEALIRAQALREKPEAITLF